MRSLGQRGIVWIQALVTGITFPVLNGLTFGPDPPFIGSRWRLATAPSPDLGFAWQPEALTPAARQLAGFTTLGSVVMALTVAAFLAGCLTLAVFVTRRALERRAELAVHAAVGADRAQLKRAAYGGLGRAMLLGAVLGLAFGLGLEAVLVGLAPHPLIPPAGSIASLGGGLASLLPGGASGGASFPISLPGLLALFGPAAAVWAAAGAETGRVLRRIRAPLRLGPPDRLVHYALGVGYVGALVALLTTAAILARSAVGTEVDPLPAEARDTVVIDLPGALPVEMPGDRTSVEMPGHHLTALRRVRDTSQDMAWHLVSAGALEGLGVADVTLAECDCVLGTIVSPFRRAFAQHHAVTPGLFASLRIPVVKGREFEATDDTGAERVAIIDRRVEARFAGVDPIGKVIRVGGSGLAGAMARRLGDVRRPGDARGARESTAADGRGSWYRIIGVVDPPQPGGLAVGSRPIGNLYLSALQHPPSRAQLVARASEGFEERLSRAGLTLAPGAIRTLAERFAAARHPIRWFALLVLGVTAGLVAIAVWGLMGLVWIDVDSRIPELGVHRALGGRAKEIRRLVRRDVARMIGAGSVLGAMAANGLSAGLSDRFAALEGLDPVALGLVVLVLAAAGWMASIDPARRAARVPPIDAIERQGGSDVDRYGPSGSDRFAVPIRNTKRRRA